MLRNGLAPKRFMLRFAGSSEVGRSPFLPANLQPYAQKLRMDVRQLLYGHTVFPYVVAFMAPDEVRRLEKLFSGAEPQRVSVGSLLRPFSKRFHRLYFCPECAQQDFKLYGESYWHRVHNLPGIQVCVLHETELRASDTEVTTQARLLGAPLPHQQKGRLDRRRPHLASLHLAKASARTLDSNWEHHPQWQQQFRQMALTRGFVHPNAGVASEWLANSLRAWYGESFLSAMGAPVRGSLGSWPVLLTRIASCPEMSPLRHILMDVFLKHHEPVVPHLAPARPGKKPRDLPALDQTLSRLIEQKTKALNLVVKRTTVKEMLVGFRLWQVYRHNSTNLPLTSLQLARFKATEASERKTGGRSQRAMKTDQHSTVTPVAPRSSE